MHTTQEVMMELLMDDCRLAMAQANQFRTALLAVDTKMRGLYDQTPFKEVRQELSSTVKELDAIIASTSRDIKQLRK